MIYRGVDGDKKAATNPGQFRVDADGVSTFELPFLPGNKPYAVGFLVLFTGPKVQGVTRTIEGLPDSTATCTPQHGGEGHWSVNCVGDTRVILSTYDSGNPAAVIRNPNYKGGGINAGS